MAEQVRFYFDPICPWCDQTSRWAHRLEELGVIELDWGVFSLARVHERGEPLEQAATVEGALEGAGLNVALRDKAVADETTVEQVAAEHRDLCERTRSFGVPTIVLDGGAGSAIFGPVISERPDDEDAVEQWQHVSWLVKHDSFAELKRDRLAAPDLESVRRWQRARHEEEGSRP